MKRTKSRYLLILVGIAVILLAGSSYLFIQEAKTENPEPPSTAAIQSGTPSVVANRPGGIPGEDIKPEKPGARASASRVDRKQTGQCQGAGS